jgi:small subunit ribosomal protein S20
MPVIKSAIKKLRRDRKREKLNDDFRTKLDRAIKSARTKKSQAAVSAAVSLVDKAVKKNIIHKNRAAHIKASFEKHKATKPASTVTGPTKTKSAAKKTSSKTSKK